MKVSEIIYRVKAAIDELPNSGEGNIVGDEAYDNLSSIIRDKIPYALEWVLTNAPQTKIDSSMVTSFEGGSAESGGQLEMTFGTDYMVTVKLPDNFLRILSARLSSWYYSPVPVSEFSETALLQQSRVAKGCPDMPVTVLCTEDRNKVLKMYTAESKKDKLYVEMICKPETTAANDTADIAVPTKTIKSFIYYIAYLTLLAFRDASASNFLAEASRELSVNKEE